MAIVPKFGNSLKLESRASGVPVALGPAYGNGIWIAIRGDGYLVTSTNGTDWTVGVYLSNFNQGYLSKLSFVNGQFVLLSTLSGASNIKTSTDGVTWTDYTLKRWDGYQILGDIAIKDVTYSNGKYWAVSTLADQVFSSLDLTKWIRATYIPAPYLNTTTYTGQRISASGNTIVAMFTRPDVSSGKIPFALVSLDGGATWTVPYQTYNENGDHTINSVGYVGNQWLAVGNNGMLYGPTGYVQNEWTVIAGPTGTSGVNWLGVGEFKGKIIIVGSKYNNAVGRYEEYYYVRVAGVWVKQTLYGSSLVNVTNNFAANLQTVATDGNRAVISQWTTTDATNWTVTNYRIPNQQPYLDYGQDNRYGNWKTIDFWVYVEGSTYNFTQYPIVSQYLNDTNYWAVYLESLEGGYNPRVIFTSSDTSLGNGSGIVFSSSGPRNPGDGNNFQGTVIPGQWNHIRIVRNTSVGAIYINGQFDVANNTNFTAPNTAMPHDGHLTIARIGDGYESYRGRDVAYWIDEFTMNSNPLNTPSAQTISVPTTPWTNTDTTLIMLHFDTNYLDDTRIPVYGEAQLASAATLIPSPTVKISASATLSSVNSVAVQAFAGHPSNIVLQSRFVTTADAKRIRTITKELNAVTVQNVAIIRKRSATAAFIALASEVTTAVRIKPATTNLSTQALIIAVANVKRRAQANLVSTSTLTAQLPRDITLSSVSTLQAIATAKRSGQVHLSSRATLYARPEGLITVVNEARYWIIPREDKGWTIALEDRINTIT